MIPLMDLKAQYRSLKPEIDLAIARVLGHTQFIQGPEVRSFEAAFAAACGAPHAIGVASGTAAIHLALVALGIGPGDEVITSAHTFIASAEPIIQVGARPVFVDVEAGTGNLDPAHLEEAITPQTRALLPVHLYGQPADMPAILEVAARHNLLVIEDAAQAHGALCYGRHVGLWGQAGTFSFYPGKNLGAYGDAGAIITGDNALAARLRMLRDHGRSEKYLHSTPGFGERLDALQAAILAAKLPRLEAWNERRREIAEHYRHVFAGLPLRLPPERDGTRHVYHQFPVYTQRRDALQAHLQGAGVGTGIHYPVPLHLQPALAHLGYRQGDLPVTEELANTELSLPIYPELTAEQIETITGAVRSFFAA
jgi:dTDP-4-amino-4,6-dideoxygalactose transaminase